jgi:hypothetical protein
MKLQVNCSELVTRVGLTEMESVSHYDEQDFHKILRMVDKLESIGAKDIHINPSDGGSLDQFKLWINGGKEIREPYEYFNERKYYKKFMHDVNFLDLTREVIK